MPGTARRSHPYHEGQLVRDLQHHETFAFNEERDGERARTCPGKLRPATPEEEWDHRMQHADLGSGTNTHHG